MKTIVYQGPFRPGVFISETGEECDFGKAVEVPDDIAERLLETGDWSDRSAQPAKPAAARRTRSRKPKTESQPEAATGAAQDEPTRAEEV